MNTKNTALITLLILFFILEALIAINFIFKQEEIRESRTSLYKAVIDLKSEIGYVGLIHNLKNYLLRPKRVEYMKNAIGNYQSALLLVENIEHQAKNVSFEVKLPQTRRMLDSYRARLDRIHDLAENDMVAREIDALIQFDDYLAHKELEDTSFKIINAIEDQLSKTLVTSMRQGVFVFIAIIITLTLTLRYYSREQKKALMQSQALNAELLRNKNDLTQANRAMLNVIDDVNQEKKRVTLLNNRLKRKNEEMEQFVYTVSHDLKSPLVTIGGFAKKLEEELYNQLSPKQVHRFSRILENVNQMENLLKDLLQLSKVIKQEIDRTYIDVEQVLKKQCRLLENEVTKAKAAIDTIGPLHKIFANERLFAQCVQNLIANAIQYRDQHRPLTVTVLTEERDEHISVSIQDNGIGIDANHHQRIFRIFERLGQGEGTGVGLTIVKTIMEKHQGKVELYSKPNVGSEFRLVFPNAPKNQDAA